jgi:hypothetical protein
MKPAKLTTAVFLGATENQIAFGKNDDPNALLTNGGRYEVEEIEVHTMHTKIYLKDFPGRKFNSASFSFDDNDEAVHEAVKQWRLEYTKSHAYDKPAPKTKGRAKKKHDPA